MASSLGLDQELDTAEGDEHGHDHEHDHDQGAGPLAGADDPESGTAAELSGETTSLDVDDEEDTLHPWAREMYRRGLSFNGNERTRLFLNGGDQGFLDLSDVSGADSPLDGRALIAADFDDDMDVDLFVHNIQRERHNLFRNDVGRGSGVKLRLQATDSQYEAVGAKVVVEVAGRKTAQVMTRGGGFASCQAPELIFGLADAADCAVEVHWPWGEVESFGRVPAGQRALLVQGTGEAQPQKALTAPLPEAWPDGLKLDYGEAVPSLVLVDASGESIGLDPKAAAQAAGGELWLCFWASYCRPCVAELPLLEELHAAEGTGVVAISVDVPDDRGRAMAQLERSETSFPAYFLAFGEEQNRGALDELVDLLRLPIPTAIRLNDRGEIVEVLQGPLPNVSLLVPNVAHTPR